MIAHPFNLDIALEAADQVGIPRSNVWSICDDPKNRVPNWKSVLVKGSQEANPIKLSDAECRSTLAYLCFSSGTTGNT